MVQKKYVRMCIHRAKPVIIATQMMEMHARSTDRERITDVADDARRRRCPDAERGDGDRSIPGAGYSHYDSIIREVEKEKTVYNQTSCRTRIRLRF